MIIRQRALAWSECDGFRAGPCVGGDPEACQRAIATGDERSAGVVGLHPDSPASAQPAGGSTAGAQGLRPGGGEPGDVFWSRTWNRNPLKSLTEIDLTDKNHECSMIDGPVIVATSRLPHSELAAECKQPVVSCIPWMALLADLVDHGRAHRGRKARLQAACMGDQ